MCRCDSFKFGHHIGLCFQLPAALEIVQAFVLEDERGYENVQMLFTCIRIWQVELRPGVPWSAAVTVKAYSARSAHLRGEAVLSSPLVGLKEKRSTLGPSEDATDTYISSRLNVNRQMMTTVLLCEC